MQGIQNSQLSSSQQASAAATEATAAQQGSFKGAALTHAAQQGQLLPSNMEEVAMFRHNFKPLGGRKTGIQDVASEERQKHHVNAAKATQDSAEEAGMMASKFKDKKAIKKAKGDSASPRDDRRSESLSALFKKVPDLSREKITEFVKSILEQPPSDTEALVDGMLSKFRDVTHKYLGLLEFKAQVQAELETFAHVKGSESERLSFLSKLNILLNQHIKELTEEAGSDIRAGLNVTNIAVGYATGAQLGATTHQLREFYRDYVMNYTAMFEAYKKILKRFKKGGFKQGKKFLFEALVADMSSAGPSISEERLSAIIKDMKILRAIERMHEESDRLYFRLSKKYHLGKGKQDVMVDRLLAFFDGANYRASLKKKITGLQKEVGIKHLGGNINLMTGLKAILSGMPVTLFKNDTERRTVLETVQKALDALIDKEVKEADGEKEALKG